MQILHQEEQFIIVSKPSGLTVHRGDLTPDEEKTLAEFLVEEFPEIKNVGEEHRPGIVHRLDKEVSGVMVIARTKEAYTNLVSQFKERTVQKNYTACVYDHTKQDSGEINLAIKRSKKNYSKFTTGSGKDALTHYSVIKRCEDTQKGLKYTLLDVSPKTGRTHQIRVHLKAIGHPIVSDKKYCFKPQRKIQPISRLFLHASQIEFSHPATQEKVTFKAELPEELTNFLESLSCA